ncbi:hypothetical protein VNI00_003533 [Paramarasmius palmivorus]|uniref:Uncharacterized protein n=1 Tax=Paramarasmius palmivorus TaxID=297713 RepID=A0AAW0DRP6_9AGAR
MGRWTQYDEDEYRLPPGVRRTGYDADTGVYSFSNGTKSRPHARYTLETRDTSAKTPKPEDLESVTDCFENAKPYNPTKFPRVAQLIDNALGATQGIVQKLTHIGSRSSAEHGDSSPKPTSDKVSPQDLITEKPPRPPTPQLPKLRSSIRPHVRSQSSSTRKPAAEALKQQGAALSRSASTPPSVQRLPVPTTSGTKDNTLSRSGSNSIEPSRQRRVALPQKPPEASAKTDSGLSRSKSLPATPPARPSTPRPKDSPSVTKTHRKSTPVSKSASVVTVSTSTSDDDKKRRRQTMPTASSTSSSRPEANSEKDMMTSSGLKSPSLSSSNPAHKRSRSHSSAVAKPAGSNSDVLSLHSRRATVQSPPTRSKTPISATMTPKPVKSSDSRRTTAGHMETRGRALAEILAKKSS